MLKAVSYRRRRIERLLQGFDHRICLRMNPLKEKSISSMLEKTIDHSYGVPKLMDPALAVDFLSLSQAQTYGRKVGIIDYNQSHL